MSKYSNIFSPLFKLRTQNLNDKMEIFLSISWASTFQICWKPSSEKFHCNVLSSLPGPFHWWELSWKLIGWPFDSRLYKELSDSTVHCWLLVLCAVSILLLEIKVSCCYSVSPQFVTTHHQYLGCWTLVTKVGYMTEAVELAGHWKELLAHLEQATEQ